MGTIMKNDTSTDRSQAPTDVGMNRTGIATSPIDSKRLVEAANDGASADGDSATLAIASQVNPLEAERLVWAQQAGPVGSMPPPASLKGTFKTLMEQVQGHKPTVFLDKLGERIQFERTGTRLYDALLVKFDAADVHQGGPTRAELQRIRDDEHRHFLLLCQAMEKLGADPTAQTPCADVIANAGAGWVQVLCDPRTTLTQCLDVILVAELADTDGWMLLADLAAGLGFDDLSREFRTAMAQEEEHLMRVRAWVSAAVLGQSGVAPTSERSDGGLSAQT